MCQEWKGRHGARHESRLIESGYIVQSVMKKDEGSAGGDLLCRLFGTLRARCHRCIGLNGCVESTIERPDNGCLIARDAMMNLVKVDQGQD